MKYSFSSHFLKIAPPATSFGDAWECLCFDLLKSEGSHSTVERLMPPDKGIDILADKTDAYQCKSLEHGEHGSMSHSSTIDSIKTASNVRSQLGWKRYLLATNAYYTGTARAKVEACAKKHEIDDMRFLGPDVWDDLCQKHGAVAEKWLSYRIRVSEAEIEEAFRKARYYDNFVKEYMNAIDAADFKLILTNNRTPLEFEVPFSKELTVENLVDVCKGLFGVDTDRHTFNDLGTSFGPSLSLTLEQKAQPFRKKIGELELESGMSVQFWIKIVWRDQTDSQGTQIDPSNSATVARFCMVNDFNWSVSDRTQLKQSERRKLTIERAESVVQTLIWETAHARLRK